jgi:demethylphylloquinone reductase
VATGPQAGHPRSLAAFALQGGFGGLYTAVRLEALMWPEGRKPDITLVDQNDRFLFKPLMYELLTKKAPEFEVAPEFATLLAPYSVR